MPHPASENSIKVQNIHTTWWMISFTTLVLCLLCPNPNPNTVAGSGFVANHDTCRVSVLYYLKSNPVRTSIVHGVLLFLTSARNKNRRLWQQLVLQLGKGFTSEVHSSAVLTELLNSYGGTCNQGIRYLYFLWLRCLFRGAQRELESVLHSLAVSV